MAKTLKGTDEKIVQYMQTLIPKAQRELKQYAAFCNSRPLF